MSAPTSTITWNNLNSSTTYQFDKTVKDGVFNSNMLLNKLYAKKKTYDGGLFITEPIMKSRGNGGSYTGAQVLTPTDKEIIETAVFNPAHYEVDITMSYTDDLANRGSAAKFDLMAAKYQNAISTMRYYLTYGIFGTGVTSTYGNAPIVGLQAAVSNAPTSDPSAGAYGGISRGSGDAYAFWRNQVDTAATVGVITMALLQALWGACSDGNEHPDIIVCTQAIYDQIWYYADARQRLGNEEAAKLGYTSIDFNGVPIIVDKDCATGDLYMLNTDYIYLKVHKDDDMAATPFLQPTTQLVKVKYITWTGQLVCSNPRRQARLHVTA
jgi:hypothetical protein